MFTDKTILITGGAAGIGRACAEAFLGQNATVILSDIDEAKGKQAALEISQKHSKGNDKGKIQFIQTDVASKKSVEALAAHLPKIDVLVNNAGIIHTDSFLELSEENFDRVLNVNLKGAFLVGQMAARKMVATNTKGAIINMSSVNGILAIGNQIPYVVSKGGLNQLTKVMALALAPHQIRVNGVGPGSIMTDLLKVVMNDETAKKRILSRTPMGRCGEPEEIAKVVLFLASDQASYMTGQTIYADGGRLALNYTV